MRKILLGTTAVVGAALMGPSLAQAQEAPTVRIGGFFRAYYGYIQQTGTESITGNVLPTNVSGGAANQAPDSANHRARLGKHDISTNAEVHVFVNGKAANGLTYGAVLEINFDQQEGRSIDQARGSTGKTTAALDEAYAFIASPAFGQIRVGDEDGPMGGLMNSGVVTNFGTGGIYGEWEDFVVRQRGGRTQTAPGGLGDSSKIIYLSPQFFGFDFGASWAFNYNEGADTGCSNNVASLFCDRAYAATGYSNFGIAGAGPNVSARRNEWQLMGRWRGSFGGVGLAVSAGYSGSTAGRELTAANITSTNPAAPGVILAGTQHRLFNNLNVWEVGAQATAYGFTVGAQWVYGDANFFWGNTVRGDRPMNQYFLGASYTNGPFTVGANYVFGTFEGGSRHAYNPAAAGAGSQTGLATQTCAPGASCTLASMRRWGFGIGANYRIAPGMDLLAEYINYRVFERNRDLDPVQPGIQSRANANVFLTGLRLAF
jgi:hypothetical protein